MRKRPGAGRKPRGAVTPRARNKPPGVNYRFALHYGLRVLIAHQHGYGLRPARSSSVPLQGCRMQHVTLPSCHRYSPTAKPTGSRGACGQKTTRRPAEGSYRGISVWCQLVALPPQLVRDGLDKARQQSGRRPRKEPFPDHPSKGPANPRHSGLEDPCRTPLQSADAQHCT